MATRKLLLPKSWALTHKRRTTKVEKRFYFYGPDGEFGTAYGDPYLLSFNLEARKHEGTH